MASKFWIAPYRPWRHVYLRRYSHQRSVQYSVTNTIRSSVQYSLYYGLRRFYHLLFFVKQVNRRVLPLWRPSRKGVVVLPMRRTILLSRIFHRVKYNGGTPRQPFLFGI